MRRTLLSLKFRWRRPRHELPRDPAAASIMWQLCERRLKLPTEAVVLALDECDVHLLPVLRAMWMRQRAAGPHSHARHQSQATAFGALDLVTGQWLYQVLKRKRSIEFLAFLEHLLCVCPGRPLFRVLDNASIHKAKVVQAWLAEHPQVQLLYLPAYSGHKHNPVEKIWWRLKDRVAANRLHVSIDALVEAVHEFFASFTPEDALQLAA